MGTRTLAPIYFSPHLLRPHLRCMTVASFLQAQITVFTPFIQTTPLLLIPLRDKFDFGRVFQKLFTKFPCQEGGRRQLFLLRKRIGGDTIDTSESIDVLLFVVCTHLPLFTGYT